MGRLATCSRGGALPRTRERPVCPLVSPCFPMFQNCRHQAAPLVAVFDEWALRTSIPLFAHHRQLRTHYDKPGRCPPNCIGITAVDIFTSSPPVATSEVHC